MSFTQKAIDVSIKLGKGSFGEDGFDTVTLSGLRVHAAITKTGSPSFFEASIRVFGVQPSIMNQITSLWVPSPKFRNNMVIVSAGDLGGAMALAFEGGIAKAWVDIQAPDASLNIYARAALVQTMQPVPPTSYPGPADVAVIMAKLAEQMGFQFENSGVNGVVLSNPYLPGTAMMQAQRVADAADINMAVDGDTLAIWPRNGMRGSQGGVPLISAATGMIGYPSFNGSGITVRQLFNPAVKYGAAVKVDSVISAATIGAGFVEDTKTDLVRPEKFGIWYVTHLTHNLDAQTPGGNWASDIEGVAVDFL